MLCRYVSGPLRSRTTRNTTCCRRPNPTPYAEVLPTIRLVNGQRVAALHSAKEMVHPSRAKIRCCIAMFAQLEQAVRTTSLHNGIAAVLLKSGTARCNRRCAHNSPVSAMAFRTELRTAIAKGGGTALPIIWRTRVSDKRLGNLVAPGNPWIRSNCFLENFNHVPSSSSAILKLRGCPGA